MQFQANSMLPDNNDGRNVATKITTQLTKKEISTFCIGVGYNSGWKQ